MKTKHLQKLIVILTAVAVTAVALPSMADSQDSKAEDLDTLRECAVLKKQIFRWELRVLKDLRFMERNLKQLKTKRVRIQGKIEELEFILKSEHAPRDPSQSPE